MHIGGDVFGLDFGELKTLFIAEVIVVCQRLEEERNVVGGTFGADALDEGMLDVVDFGVVEGIVIEQDFDAVATQLNDALDAPL